MLVYFDLCVCLLSLLHGSVNPSDNLENTRQTDDSSGAGNLRVFRSTFRLLPASIRSILAAAYEVPTRSTFRKFIKTGTQEIARKDYLSLKPIFPNGKEFASRGFVDDFDVRIRFTDKSTGFNPTLIVRDLRGGERIKIVYKTIDDELHDLLSRIPRASGIQYSRKK